MIPFFNTAVTVLRNTVVIKPARLADLPIYLRTDLALKFRDNISIGSGELCGKFCAANACSAHSFTRASQGKGVSLDGMHQSSLLSCVNLPCRSHRALQRKQWPGWARVGWSKEEIPLTSCCWKLHRLGEVLSGGETLLPSTGNCHCTLQAVIAYGFTKWEPKRKMVLQRLQNVSPQETGRDVLLSWSLLVF